MRYKQARFYLVLGPVGNMLLASLGSPWQGVGPDTETQGSGPLHQTRMLLLEGADSYSTLRILGLSMAGVGPSPPKRKGLGPENPICLRARILRVLVAILLH